MSASATTQRLARRARHFASAARFETALLVAANRASVQPAAARGRVKGSAVRHNHGDAPVLASIKAEALYLAVVTLAGRGQHLAAIAGITQQAISKTVIAVERRREDPNYDRKLDELELELMGVMA